MQLNLSTVLPYACDFDPSLSLADPAEYVTQLKATMAKLRASSVCKQSPKKPYVSNDLSSCTHVRIRHDGTRKPLQRSYDGLYKVRKQDDKHFMV